MLRTIIGILSVMFSTRDPYDEGGHAPQVIGKTERGVLVKAESGTEALDATVKGQTAAGKATFAAVHKGNGIYEVKRKEF